MTLSAGDARDEYTASASQTVFNYTFKIYSATDLDVYVTPSGQQCTDGDLTTSYTVSGVGAEAGGTITLTTPASFGDLVTIVSSIPTSRTTDYQNNGDFRPDTVNDDFDRVVSLVKQIQDIADRSLQFLPCEQGVSSLSLPAPSAGQFVRWKSDLSGFENVSIPLDDFNAISEDVTVVDGQLTYTLTSGGLDTSTARVEIAKTGTSIDGTLLIKDIDYTSDTASTFSLLQSYPGGIIRVSNFISGAQTESQTVVEDGPVELIAHRGFKLNSYENTLLAMSYALNQGADSLECDASISSDGVWYLFHDTTVDALTTGTGTFTALTSTYLDTLSYDKSTGTPNAGLGITKLDDFLSFVRETGVKAYIEMKHLRNSTTDVDDFMAKIASFGLTKKIVATAGSIGKLTRARSNSADITLSLVLSQADTATAISLARSASANIISNDFNFYLADTEMASSFTAAGFEPVAYTVDRKSIFNQLLAVGVRKITSDRSTVK
jgi:glycerophosphoryl diester phosphodiesterase